MTIAEAMAFRALEERLAALEKRFDMLVGVVESLNETTAPVPAHASAGYLRAGANKRKVA